MAAQVIIELLPDVSKVKSALAELGDSGAVSNSSADSFKAGNAELTKRNALLSQQAQAQSKIEAAERKEIATLGQVQKAASAVAGTVIKLSGKEFTNAMNAQAKSAQGLVTALAGVTGEVKKQVAAEESLRAQKRRLTEEIGKMIAAGQAESAMYQDLVRQAGEIDDAMGDANAAISRAGSDTRGLDNAIMVATGVAAGFSVAAGAAALFGDESEETQKVLLKVNAAMSILSGLQQIQNILRSEELKSMIASLITQRARNAQIVIENGLQSRSIIVRTAATGAQWLLNAAMSANPIGAVVVVLTAAVLAMRAYTEWAGKAAAAQAVLNGALDTSGIDAEMDVYERNHKKRMADLSAQGAKQSEINKEEASYIALRGEAIAKELTGVKAVLAANKEASEDRTKLVEREATLEKQLNDLRVDRYVKQKELGKSIQDEQKKSAEDAKAAAEKAMQAQEKAAEAARKRAMLTVADRRAAAELTVLMAQEGSKIELEARIGLIKEIAAAELLQADLTINQRKLIIAKSEKEIADLRQKFDQEAFRKQYEGQRDMLARLEELRLQQIEERAAKEQALTEKSERLEKARLNALARGGDDVTKSEAERFRAVQDLRNEELTNIQKHLLKIESQYAFDAISKEEYEKKKTELVEQEAQKQFEIEQANAARIKAIRDAIIGEAIEAAQNAAAAMFEVGAAQRQAEYDNAVRLIDKEREHAMNAKNLTEQQKSDIQKKYDAELRKIKNDAAKKERRAQVTQAIVNGALAVVNALATAPWPYNLIAAAGAGVATGIQIAKINSTPIPAFAKGTTSAPRGYALVGEEGPEIVKLNGGERIWTANQSDKMMKEWNAANHTATINGTRGGSSSIDYDALGKAVAKYLPKGTSVNVNMDKDGYTMFVLSENHKKTFRNQRYTTG